MVLSTIYTLRQPASPCEAAKVVVDLLQLLVLQVAPNHHLQHDKQFAVADVSISIDVVDLEREPQFLLLVTLGAECAEAGHEFLEVDVASTVFVKDGYHTACQCGRGQR